MTIGLFLELSLVSRYVRLMRSTLMARWTSWPRGGVRGLCKVRKARDASRAGDRSAKRSDAIGCDTKSLWTGNWNSDIMILCAVIGDDTDSRC